ncbi:MULTISPECIES: hypothetical protein [Vibrio]|uniref:hypothetical protein n=1 Tax=Vibrio TaxID=662 RepID=UPI00186A2747|nr:hypothetical protein [Vibrio navarrensis]ELF1354513.1 hypothetical protein [Vibrio cholerae]MBE4594702.1 hypothetical protein [Vibrio navarrensis]
MSNEIIITKTPKNIYGHLVYLDDFGNTVIEHLSGGTIIIDERGVGVFNKTDGTKTVINLDGSSESFDPDGEYLGGTPPIRK